MSRTGLFHGPKSRILRGAAGRARQPPCFSTSEGERKSAARPAMRRVWLSAHCAIEREIPLPLNTTNHSTATEKKMTTITQTIPVPADRRIVLEFFVPDEIPTDTIEVSVIMQPHENSTPPKTFEDYIGKLAGSDVFSGDPVQIQKAMRDEW